MNKKNIKKTPFAKKSFGQNFLVDENYIEKIITALNPQKGETVIEIGAGRGALTERLLESGANVIAIELEREMIAVLKEKFAEFENFQLVEGDALKVDFEELLNRKSQIANRKSKLVANLPYYISTAILQKLIEQRAAFSEMILMFQREVVERITAEVGNKERGFLTVLTEAFLDAEKLVDVPPNAFRPAPKVWSAVVRLITKKEVNNLEQDEKLFRELISAGFAQKRKTILNNLKSAPPDLREKIGNAEDFLKKAGIAPNRRAESLGLEEWKQIYEALTQKDLS
jgi:16S rRNA (adenine1518-N6/adenine1519-N6)-dimethyltransferase